MDPRFHLLSEIPLPLSFSSTFTVGSSSSSSSGFSQDDPWMNPRIWSRLPTWILDRVIAFLPPPVFFRSRCVCRRWYGLLFSDSFLQLYLRVLQPRRRWFFFFKSIDDAIDNNNNNRTERYLFDPYELVWYRLPFPTVPPSGFSLAASAGGLVCWMSDNPAPKTLLLANPLSCTINQLPPTLTSRYQPSISFTVTRTTIDVSLAGDDLVNKALAVKNSTAERFRVDGTGLFLPTWQITSPLPRLYSFESGGRMVHLHGRIYNMSYHPFTVATFKTCLFYCLHRTELHSIATKFGSIAAQFRKSPDDKSGFAFLNCRVTGKGPLYVGRAMGKYARSVYSYTYFDDVVAHGAWDDWNTTSTKTDLLGVYKCWGPGAKALSAVSYAPELDFDTAHPFLRKSFVNGGHWIAPSDV